MAVDWKDFAPVSSGAPKTSGEVDWNQFEPVKPESFGAGIARGGKEAFQQLPQLGYGMLAGAGAAIESVAGEGGIGTGLKKAGVEGYTRWGDKIAAGARESDSWDYSWDQAKQGNFGALVDWVAHGIGYTGGQGLQMLVGAGIGTIAGKATLGTVAETVAVGLVKKEAMRLAEGDAAKAATSAVVKEATANVAGTIGQTSAVAAGSFGQEGGQIFGDLVQNAEKEGRTLTGSELGKAFGASLVAGGLEFVGDKLGLDVVLGKSPLLKLAPNAKGIPGRLARGGIAAAAEAPVEGATEYLQSGLEQFGSGQDQNILPWNQNEENQRQARESAALGMLGGVVMGGAGGALHGPRKQPAPPPGPPPEAPRLLTHEPDPYVQFADGTVARQSEANAYINSLPEDQQQAARARMMGMAPQPVEAAAATAENPITEVLAQDNIDDAIDAAKKAVGYRVGIPVGEATELNPPTLTDELTNSIRSIPVGQVSEEDLANVTAPLLPVGEATEMLPVGQTSEIPTLTDVVPPGSALRRLNIPTLTDETTAPLGQRVPNIPVGETSVPPLGTATEAWAKANAHIESILDGDLLTRDGMPYGSKTAAGLRARREGFGPEHVIEIPNAGWVVRPILHVQPQNMPGFTAQNTPGVMSPTGAPVAPVGAAPGTGATGAGQPNNAPGFTGQNTPGVQQQQPGATVAQPGQPEITGGQALPQQPKVEQPPKVPEAPGVPPTLAGGEGITGGAAQPGGPTTGEAQPPAGPVPRKGTIGMKLGAGEVVLTSTGRHTTPFPEVKLDTDRKTVATVKAVDRWLMQNAIDEARSRGDNFNLRQFESNLEKPQQADKDSAEEYLFGGGGEGRGQPGGATEPGEPQPPTGHGRPTVGKNTIFTEDAAAKAREVLKRKLGQLSSGIDPEIIHAGITLAGYHIEKGARTFAAYAKAMVADLGDAVKPHLKSWYMAVKYDPRASNIEGLDEAAHVEKFDVDRHLAEAESKAAGPIDISSPSGRAQIAGAVAKHFHEGRGFKTIRDARKFIAERAGSEAIEPGTPQAKIADEAIEAGVVLAARRIVEDGRQQGSTDGEIFDRLVSLYGAQPNLGVRTSTSVREQAYSTPMPLAFVASRLAGIKPGMRVGEPTAGNGALLIEVAPSDAVVNELNPERAAALREQGFEVTTNNAAITPLSSAKSLDAEVMNPPFGATGTTFSVMPEYSTGEIDHAIAFEALKALKDDGDAVLIVGGIDAQSQDQIRDGYRGKAKREFYYNLYRQYQVVDHFTVDGGLYSRQGAGYPVDVIVIRGRGQSTRALPAADLPQRLSTWEEVKGKIDGTNRVAPAGNRPGADGGNGAAGSTERQPVVGRPGRPSVGHGIAGAEPRGGNAGGGAGPANAGAGLPGAGGTDVRPGERGPANEPGPSGASQPVPGNGEVGGSPGATSDIRNGLDDLDRVGGIGSERREPGLEPRRDKEVETQTQATYEPGSDVPAIGTLVPVNMRDAIAQALSTLKDRVEDLDQFVCDELGYSAPELADHFSAEQVDALALAIYSAKQGKGFIIGDQTGLGKGRVVAAMIRYAMRNDQIPIFITEKPNLYADMIRDLDDIGMTEELGLDTRAPAILMTNNNDSVPYVLVRGSGDDAVEHQFLLRSNANADALRKMQNEDGIGRYRVIFTTYDQMRTVDQQLPQRAKFIEHFADGNYVIADESHNAGGTTATQTRTKAQRDAAKAGLSTTTGRAAFLRRVISKSTGSFFSSATYAKRPDVMDLYSTTNMMLGVARPADLAPAIKAGGVPMQQAVATMLAQDGQYIRRERSFDGVSYETRAMHVDHQTAENMATSMRRILEFSRAKESAVSAMQDEMDKAGARVSVTGEANHVQGANFGAVMHNLIDQMLLSLKAKDSVEYAIERLRKGEKVVLTVSNTMGSFLKDFADDVGIRPGEPVSLSFADLYRRYLEKQREVTIRHPNGDKEKVRLTDEDLGPRLTQMYEEIGEFIDNAGFGDAPISPIDYMHQALRAAGFKTDEITGRTITLNYGRGDLPVLGSRSANIKQRSNAISGFNSGSVDALILNQAGSTGLSLHSSKKFKDQRQRHMIVVQPEKNIDTHMQMLGRVMRTGQMNKPRYTQAMADIPAEGRPAAILLKKMASLNANTTASRKSAVTAEGVVDFMNDYGGQVAHEFLMDNPDIHRALGGGRVLRLGDNSAEATEEVIRKFSGYIPILPISLQEQVYSDIVGRYNELIERENAMGTNKLEAHALDLDAKTLSSETVTPARTDTDSKFGAPAVMERVDVKRTVKPMTGAEVKQAQEESLQGKSSAQSAREQARKASSDTSAYLANRLQTLTESGADAGRIQFEQNAVTAQLAHVQSVLNAYPVGTPVQVSSPDGIVYGVVTGLESAGRTKNPVAGSNWKMTLAVANGDSRTLTLDFGKIGAGQRFDLREQRAEVPYFNATTQVFEQHPIADLFDLGSGNIRRERRWMVTGNLLAGFSAYQGRIVKYTKSDGTEAQGVLMSRLFDFDKAKRVARSSFSTSAQVLSFFDRAPQGSWVSGGGLKISAHGNSFDLIAPRSKSAGGQFFLDKGLTDITGDFTSSGQTMVATVYGRDKIERAIKHLLDKGEVKLSSTSHPAISNQVLGIGQKTVAPDANLSRTVTRRDVLAAAAAAAISPSSEASVTLGRAKPIDANVLDQSLSVSVQKILRNGREDGVSDLAGAKVIRDAMREIATAGPFELRPLAKQIADLLPEKGVLLTVQPGKWNAHGAVRLGPEGPHLMLMDGPGHKGMTFATFMHESLHLAVLARYRALSSGVVRSNDKLLGMSAPHAAAAMGQFRRVWDEFRDATERTSAATADEQLALKEARSTPDEFFVRALTDAGFQRLLAGIEYRGQSLWEKFKDWVKTRLFGLVKDGIAPSWLDAALTASQDVLGDMRADSANFDRARREMSLSQRSVAHLSRADQAVDRVRFLVDGILEGWKNAPDVVVVHDMNDPALPESTHAEYSRLRERGTVYGAPQGWYDQESGKIFLLAGQLPTDKLALKVLMHEALGHYGLRGVFGDKFGEMLDRFAIANAERVRKMAEDLGYNYDDVADRRSAVEELLAYMAENTPKYGWVRKFVAAITGWLREHVPGFSKMGITDSEIIRDFIVPARDWVRNGGQARGGNRPFGTAMFRRQTLMAALRNAGGGEKIIGNTGRAYEADTLDSMRHTGMMVDKPTLEQRVKNLWEGAGDKIVQGMFDQFAPVKAVSTEAYNLLRGSKGASGAFEVLLKGGLLRLTDNFYDFDERARGGAIDRWLKPLQGEHHDFLRWVAAHRAEQLMPEDREHLFREQDIPALKKLANGTTEFDYTLQHDTGGRAAGAVTRDRSLIYADSLKTFNEFNKNTLDMAEQSGLIDAESRAIWEKEFYVPFYRVADDSDGGVRGMNIKNGVVRQQAFKHLKGGTSKLNTDLMDNVLMNWAHLLDAGAKNRAAVATMKALVDSGQAFESTEIAARQAARSMGVRDQVVWVMDEGKKHFYVVQDKPMLTALTALEYAGMRGPAMKVMGAFKHALTVGVTASPFFKVRNLIRDSIQAIATGPISYNPVENVREGWKLSEQTSDAYFRLLAGGGTIHFGTMLEGSEAKRVQALVESGVDPAHILDSDSKYKAFWRQKIEPMITAYNELGNRGEAVNRASLYAQLRKQGMNHAQASIAARDLMDFSLQGAWSSIRFLAQVVPFFNARLQGMYKLGRAAKEDPKRFYGVIGATALASVALMMAYSDDDDWKRREDWDRNNYWWFKIGGEAFRIPKPFEVGAVATLAERGMELFFDKEMTSRRFRQNVLAILGDQLSMNPIPQMVKPMIDVYANVDSYTGRPIETEGMRNLAPEYRTAAGTSMTARAASTTLNAIAGTLGGKSLSPVQIDHLLQGYFSWLGTFAVQAADILARPMTGQPERPERDWLKTATGGMFSDLSDAQSRYVSQMYQQATMIEEAYHTWRQMAKEGNAEAAAAYLEEHRGEIAKYRLTERAKQAETKLNQEVKRIEVNQSMSSADKRARLRELMQQRERIARPVTELIQ